MKEGVISRDKRYRKVSKGKHNYQKSSRRNQTTSPWTARFYIQRKINKQGNPGRPVIGSVNCQTSNILKYVDYQLQPIVPQIQSYIQDTSDFLRKINKIEKYQITHI